MAFCGDCGSALQAGKSYCTGCGAFVGGQLDTSLASGNISDNCWTEQQFDELGDTVRRLGVNPSQIFSVSCSEWDFEPGWNPGEIFVIDHRLSGALNMYHKPEFWWVDYWILLRDRWGLLRYQIDEEGLFVDGGELTPGLEEMFFSEELPSFDEISSRIWLTTARFCSRAFYPLGTESPTLAERIEAEDDLPIFAQGRMWDFVRNSASVLNVADDSPFGNYQLEAARKFRDDIPPRDLVRWMNMELK